MEYRCEQCDNQAPTLSMGLQHQNIENPIFNQMVIITYITYIIKYNNYFSFTIT